MWRRPIFMATSRWKSHSSGRRHARRRSFASDVVKKGETDNTSAEECAKNLSWMSEILVSESTVATEWAQSLSPQARAELAQVRKLSSLSTSDVPEPSPQDIRLTALNQAIPFVGFGIMDNAILIVAGDAIDTSLGVALGISTMCAAAIGNIISDVAGIMLGTIIEDFTARLGLPVPNVSAAQRQLRSVRFAGQFGTTVGIVIGCIIGMFPLLLIDSSKVQRLKEEAHIDSIFRDIVEEAKDLVGAEFTRLFLVVDSPSSTKPSSHVHGEGDQYLYGKYAYGMNAAEDVMRISMGKGIVSRAVFTGEAVNVYDVHTEPDFARDIWDDEMRTKIKSMVCVPVVDSQGRVIAVIQAVNKIRKGVVRETDPPTRSERGGFTASDVQVLKVLASHVSVALQVMLEEETEMSLRDTIKTLKEHGIAGLGGEQSQSNMQGRALFPE
jgi:tRNA-specific adenosine deaminase 1